MADVAWFTHAEYSIGVFYVKSCKICVYFVFFKSKKELNYAYDDSQIRGILDIL